MSKDRMRYKCLLRQLMKPSQEVQIERKSRAVTTSSSDEKEPAVEGRKGEIGKFVQLAGSWARTEQERVGAIAGQAAEIPGCTLGGSCFSHVMASTERASIREEERG